MKQKGYFPKEEKIEVIEVQVAERPVIFRTDSSNINCSYVCSWGGVPQVDAGPSLVIHEVYRKVRMYCFIRIVYALRS